MANDEHSSSYEIKSHKTTYSIHNYHKKIKNIFEKKKDIKKSVLSVWPFVTEHITFFLQIILSPIKYFAFFMINVLQRGRKYINYLITAEHYTIDENLWLADRTVTKKYTAVY